MPANAGSWLVFRSTHSDNRKIIAFFCAFRGRVRDHIDNPGLHTEHTQTKKTTDKNQSLVEILIFAVRGINFAMLCCRIAPLVFPARNLGYEINGKVALGGIDAAASLYCAFPHTSPVEALAKNCTTQKVDKSTIFVFGSYVCNPQTHNFW